MPELVNADTTERVTPRLEKKKVILTLVLSSASFAGVCFHRALKKMPYNVSCSVISQKVHFICSGDDCFLLLCLFFCITEQRFLRQCPTAHY